MSGEVFTDHVDMDENKITSSYIATNNDDLINNKYLKPSHIANNAGYIPDLYGDINKSGFIISCSSEMPIFCAFHVFCSWKTDRKVTSKENM